MTTDTYVFDANVVINLNRDTPRDIYPSVWDAVEGLVAGGQARLPRQVYEEIARIDDACAPWAKAQPNFVVEATDAEVAVVAQITAAHPGWVQQTKNEADPWLIAYGAVHGCLVVTQERTRGPGTTDVNLAIPNVAAEYDVTCLAFNDLARREGWQF